MRFLWLILVVFGVSTLTHVVRAQISPQMKSKVEAQLEGMTQDEIDRKLKEMGMSREEAIRRAQAMGISLEDYLGQSADILSVLSLPTQQMAPQSIPPGGLSTLDSLVKARAATVPVTRMPVPGFENRLGADSAIQPFGYDIFVTAPSVFQPVLNVATPPSYVLGPGDEIVVSVWGETQLNYQLIVNREGNVVVPDVGPVGANGLTVQGFTRKLLRRMTAVYSGLKNGAANANTFLEVSLGKLRTVQIFVLGEVKFPGSYPLSSMSSVLHALYAAGGPTVNGTLRKVELTREGEKIPPVDLYSYLLLGRRDIDVRLQDGDVVFVPPAGKRVAVVGNVVRPAIYEIRSKETLADLLRLAGGLRFDADGRRVHVERVIPFEERNSYAKNVLDLDLDFTDASEMVRSTFPHDDGDIVRVFRIPGLFERRVSIFGSVEKPGHFELTPGMRVKDLILRADSLKRGTFSERGTIYRLLPNMRRKIVGFNPRLALLDRPNQNVVLENEDSVIVYREVQFQPVQTVTVTGAVRRPGTYPRHENMTVADLVVMAGGIREDGSHLGLEVARLDTTELNVFSVLFKVNLSKEYWRNGNTAPFYLEDFDLVKVPIDPRYEKTRSVKIAGHVLFPGTYALRVEGECVACVLSRAGGVREGAYLEGAKLFRSHGGAGQVPINFVRALEDTLSHDNIMLMNGDSIYVPRYEGVVYVRGEVFVPAAILYEEGKDPGYYISQAGGLKESADEDRISTFLPNGEKWEPGGFLAADPDVLPGSTVIVPRKAPKEDRTLEVVAQYATILASLAAITVSVVTISR